jgi:Activator of Hsp90 ATPase homolog 1-like protein
MTEQATAKVVRHSVTVPIQPERAFRLFTEEIGSWWPQDTHKLSDGPVTEVFEARQGGRWYELAEDGSECTVATMVVWEPPGRLVMAWQLTPEWVFEPDLERATQVEVTFEPASGGGTHVTLEHRGFEAYGTPGDEMRESVGGEEGWPVIMHRYAEVAGG